MSLISIRNLHKTYGSTVAIDNLDLSLHKGEVVVILGASGCGKSTLMQMLSGSLKPKFGVSKSINKNMLMRN